MKKSESLIMLDILGLNTVDYFITDDRKEAAHYLARHVDGKRSMRTERGYEFQCPFYYNLPGETLLPLALKHIDEGYKLIFSPSLPAQDCTAFGTIALTGEDEDVVEIVRGPGLLRELDTHPDKQTIHLAARSIVPIQDAFLYNLHKLAKAHCYDQVPCILEWSRYPYRIGKLQKFLIFWECRAYR